MATFEKETVEDYGSLEKFAAADQCLRIYESDTHFHTVRAARDEPAILSSPHIQNPRLVWSSVHGVVRVPTSSAKLAQAALRTIVAQAVDQNRPRPDRDAAKELLKKTPAASELVVSQLAHPDQLARIDMLFVLEALRTRSAVPAIMERLLDHEANVRRIAAGVLPAFGEPSVVPAVIRLLSDSDPGVRATAAGSLGRLKDARAVAPLEVLRHDPDQSVRGAVERALVDLRRAGLSTADSRAGIALPSVTKVSWGPGPALFAAALLAALVGAAAGALFLLGAAELLRAGSGGVLANPSVQQWSALGVFFAVALGTRAASRPLFVKSGPASIVVILVSLAGLAAAVSWFALSNGPIPTALLVLGIVLLIGIVAMAK